MYKKLSIFFFCLLSSFAYSSDEAESITKKRNGSFYATPVLYVRDDAKLAIQGLGVGYRHKFNHHALDLSLHFLLLSNHFEKDLEPSFLPKLSYLYYPGKSGFYGGIGATVTIPTLIFGYEKKLENGMKIFAQLDGMIVLFTGWTCCSIGIGF